MRFSRRFFNVALALVFAAPCAAQQAYQQLEIIPDFPVTAVGKLRFVDSNDYPGATHYVGLKAPADVTSNFDIELPPAPPASTRCVEMTAAGVVQFASGPCSAAGSGHPFLDSSIWAHDSADPTKQAQIQAGGITTATTRTITLQDLNLTMAGLDVDNNWSVTQTPSSDSSVSWGATAERFLAGYWDTMNAEFMEISNAAHSANWIIRQDPADNTKLEFFAGGVVWMEIVASGPALYLAASIVPTAASTYVIGTIDDEWLDIWSEDFHAGKSTTTRIQGRMFFANTTNGNTGSLVGISKDGGGTVQAANFYVTDNFYLHSRSSDIICSTGPVDDGWIGLQTTTDEIQFCEGGAGFILPSVAIAFAPVTVNCAAGEVILDPRYEDGILVEGSCGAN